MFCKFCGKEIPDDAKVCPYCAQNTDGVKDASPKPAGQPKTGIGVVLALFLGIIGLIIGLLLYPSDSVERSTFLKGWIITFVITFIAEFILGIIFYTFYFDLIMRLIGGALS